MAFNNWVEVLQARSVMENKGITFIDSEKDELTLSFKTLYHKALGVLYHLQSLGLKPGDELVFQIKDNKFFIRIFWACLLGGIRAVPLAVGTNDEHRLKLFKVWKQLNRPYLVIDGASLAGLEKFADADDLMELMKTINSRKVLLEEIDDTSGKGNVYQADKEDIGFIQFSSGSTGEPKGVVLTHHNLLVNTRGIIKGIRLEEEDSGFNWMPLTHDMGIIGFHLTPLLRNANHFIMSTFLFIRRPTLWFKKVSEHRSTILASPNFGYKYYLDALKKKPQQDLDLSCVRVIFNGAEPISSDLCNEFLDTMQTFGFNRKAMFTTYGLAESSLAVTFPPLGQGLKTVTLDRRFLEVGKKVQIVDPSDPNQITFVDVGYPLECNQVRITDDDGHSLPEETIGSILIKGENVTKGYYNNKEITEKTITKDGWLDTGDLGFTRNNRLIITGRTKDVLFVRGQNFYAHDVEQTTVDIGIKGIELGKIAVVDVLNKKTRENEVILFVLYKKKDLAEFAELAFELNRHINSRLGLRISYVVPVLRLPKTTSGKIQRFKLREQFFRGEFDEVIKEIETIIADEG